MYCIVSTENTSKLNECEVHTEALSFEYKFVGHPWKLQNYTQPYMIYCIVWETRLSCTRRHFKKELAKFKIDMLFWPQLNINVLATSKIIPNRRFIFFIVLEHWQVEECEVHTDSLRYEGIGQIQNWYVFLKRENLGFHLNYKFVGHPWQTSKLYPTVHAFISVFLHTVLYCFHWEHHQVEGVRSAHGVSLRYVWRNWPNSKLICYSERGEPRLSFEYKFVGHPWKLLKLYPTVDSYFLFFFTLYCIVSTENTSKLKECEVHTEAL